MPPAEPKSLGWGRSRPGMPPLPDTEYVRAATEIVRKLQSAGFEAYFVGGFVRDWLLGIDHYDVDVATSAPPEQVRSLFESTKEVGAHFGVLLVQVGHISIEVATFRAEGSYIDFRRPSEVRYGTLEEDARRRDFTINALYYDPVSGAIKDFFAGTLDLRRRILRTVGPAATRFEEDALRLMRAVRFAVRYELELEPITAKALRVKVKNLTKISVERVGEELLRILTGPHPGRAMRMMSEYGIWNQIVPEVEQLHGVEQGAEAHPEGDAFIHTALVLDHLPPDPAPELALAALLHDIAKPATQTRDASGIHFFGHQKIGAQMAAEICTRLRYSGELIDKIAYLVENHMQFMVVRQMKESTLKRLLGDSRFPALLELHRADSLGSHGDLDAYQFCVERRQELAVEHGETLQPAPLATGDDLIGLGLKPGPRFREILDALHDEQLEGVIRTREEAMSFLRTQIHTASAPGSNTN